MWWIDLLPDFLKQLRVRLKYSSEFVLTVEKRTLIPLKTMGFTVLVETEGANLFPSALYMFLILFFSLICSMLLITFAGIIRDLLLLQSGTYGDITDGSVAEAKLKMEKITIYLEHPRPIEPPAEPAPPPPQPLKLTKKEQKKLRTQRRLGREKDKQEMIRQGLIEPPKPKVKMSNLMKVLGSEATQDPTRLEKEIRSAAAEREQAHIDRNVARKLTPAERREKKERKLFDERNGPETIVSVYRINDLSHPQTRFKVDVNAQENRLSGCAVISDGITVVVVEGGNKPIKRYGKLMLKRINWASAVKEEDEDEDGSNDKPANKCVLVWQGSVAKPSFHRFTVHECLTEAAARKTFTDAGVAHYWDLAVDFSDDQI